MARTQQQRREETVARLLEASIATIIEVGYARASAAVITKNAGVSVGALFRHFDTMGDFMAATAYEVLRRQLDAFTKQAAAIPSDRPALEAVLTILRDITSSSTNAVMYEPMKSSTPLCNMSSSSTPRRSATPRVHYPVRRASRKRPSLSWWRC
jgi:AcrR family transcriptional regulator